MAVTSENFKAVNPTENKCFDSPPASLAVARFADEANSCEAHRWRVEALAYERGVAVFEWPQLFDIWNLYLAKFVKKYGGEQLEHARYLFEHCLETCLAPAKFTKNIFLVCAKLEEDYGLIRHAMSIYGRVTEAAEICDPKAVPLSTASYQGGIKPPAECEKPIQLREDLLDSFVGELNRRRRLMVDGEQRNGPPGSGNLPKGQNVLEMQGDKFPTTVPLFNH
ncbi:hypothetical protein Y032_0242g3430 [Ancylostoma ceylanicum]|uniref:Pre-mRNA-splicing factor Syf1/CRNKL1-like C-terminal HAT-repeats domain-containing protein n=1 Tax=Ancylostoma ceylanicum TaxID=53326 RepID=A0A016SEC4_9BILA|nr:hypothetical protein Y032_0242g3430 [Ancylostoma ceylanicum]